MVSANPDVASLEEMVLDTLDKGVPKSEVLDTVIKLGNRCLDQELYEAMDTVKRIHKMVEDY